jgi:hypothetical protein
VFQNRILREIFGSKREKVRGDWRKLHIEEHVASVVRRELTQEYDEET